MSTTVKRDAAAKALALFLTNIRQTNANTDLPAVEAASERLESLYNDFVNAHESVLAVTGKKDLPFQQIERENTDIIYDKARYIVDEFLHRLKGTPLEESTALSTAQLVTSASDAATFKTSVSTSSIAIGAESLPTTSVTTTPTPISQPIVNPFRKNTSTTSTSTGTIPKTTLPPLTTVSHPVASTSVANPPIGRNDNIALNAAASIQRICYWSTNANVRDTPMVLARTQDNLINTYWQVFMNAAFADNTLDFGRTYEEIEAQYVNAKANIATIIEAHAQSIPVPGNIAGDQAHQARTEIQLPRIEIPKFAGDFQAWLSFYDLFTSLVHNVCTLSDVQKMHYLRSCVEGEAELLIRSFQVTGPNYREAWGVLLARYNNRRLIINAHLEQLFTVSTSNVGSPNSLRRQLDRFTEVVRALSALELPIGHWDVLLVHILVARLDTQTKHAWEMSLVNDDIPTFNQLVAFLERRCRSLDASGQNTSSQRPNPGTRGGYPSANPPRASASNRPRVAMASASSRTTSCSLCKNEHYIGACPKFQSLYPGQRYRVAQEYRLCFNCLQSDHGTLDCRSATSCRKCGLRHHTMLHYDEKLSTASPAVSNMGLSTRDILLATAVTFIVGSRESVRILLDMGSQTTFITERAVQRIGLRRHKACVPVTGIGSVDSGTSRGFVKITFTADENYRIQALILPKITQSLPNSKINRSQISFINKIPSLADPSFHIPAEVDVLLGSDYL